MILVITSHDDPTSDNLTVASHLIGDSETAICGEDAVRGNVLAALAGHPAMPLLTFSHGGPRELWGQDGEHLVSLDDVALLNLRNSFAYACHTAEQLAREVAHAGGTWFGFAGPINCLPADEDSLPHFKQIVDFIAQRFPACTSVNEAEDFIGDLDALSETTFSAIETTASLEQLHALRDITRRLRIWLPGVQTSVKHREAFSDPVL